MIIGAEIALGMLVSGTLFHLLLRRAPERGGLHAAAAFLLALAIVLVVGVQIRQPPNLLTGYVLPMGVFSIALSAEGYFIARWLAAKRTDLLSFLPLYAMLLGAAAFITMMLAAALYPGS